MRWLSVAYSMTAAACLTLAAVHLLVWFQQRPGIHLAFSLTAIFVAAITPFDFAKARAQTPEQYIQALRWFHVSTAFTIGSTTARQCSGHPSFGQITNTRFPTGESGSSRQIQFAMRLIF